MMDIKSTWIKVKKCVWTPVILSIVICLGVWIGGMFLTHWMANTYFKEKESVEIQTGNQEDKDRIDVPALFGDSFGAVNALISALAFAGVIVSMYFQRKELALQRRSLRLQVRELRLNTTELGAQKTEFATQNKTMKLQRFENTFFNMLSLQQEIVNNIKYTYDNNISISGRSIFQYLYHRILENQLAKSIDNFKELSLLYLLDHYFSHLYRIITFVDETYLLENKDEKYSYIAILRSTLSRYELVFLFYNELNFPKFKEFIEEYSLFNNLDKASLFDSNGMLKEDQWDKLYAPSAYDPSIKGYNK